MPITPGLYRHFVCPLCQSVDYRYVLYTREGKPAARMTWYRCIGCTVMFTDPERFTRLVRRTLKGQDVMDVPQRGEGPLMTFVERMQQEIDDKKALADSNGGVNVTPEQLMD